MPKNMKMPVAPDGGIHVPVGISVAPFDTSLGSRWIEEWMAIVRIGTPFVLDMSPENLLLPTLLDGPLKSMRGALLLNTCTGRVPTAT